MLAMFIVSLKTAESLAVFNKSGRDTRIVLAQFLRIARA